MIPVKSITIERAEGLVGLCVTESFTSFESASSWLRSQAHTYPQGGGYDKHDFKVIFEDGETYQGRLDCKHFSEADNDLDVKAHIITHCKWYAGLSERPYCGVKNYQAFMVQQPQEQTAAYLSFLEKYLL